MNYIEQTMKHCSSCGHKTRHSRSNSKPGFGMILLHIILTCLTMGIWLVPLLVWYFMTMKVGGWTCEKC